MSGTKDDGEDTHAVLKNVLQLLQDYSSRLRMALVPLENKSINFEIVDNKVVYLEVAGLKDKEVPTPGLRLEDEEFARKLADYVTRRI